jgi:hypothetical protein
MRTAISRPSPLFSESAAAQVFMRERAGAQARVPRARSSFTPAPCSCPVRAAYALHTPSRCAGRADA